MSSNLMPLSSFTGGKDDVRHKLNEMVDAINLLRNMSGDQYVTVSQDVLGFTVRLNTDMVLPLIAKTGGGADFELLWAEVVVGLSYADPPASGSSTYRLRLLTDTTEAWESGDDYALDAEVLGDDNLKYYCITASGSGTYSPTSAQGPTYWTVETEIEVTKAVGYQGHSDTDLRNYDNWFEVGAVVPVAEVDADGLSSGSNTEWFILLAQQYCGDETDASLRHNEDEERQMAVWK